MVSERRLVDGAVLRSEHRAREVPRNLGLAAAQLSAPIGILIAFGLPDYWHCWRVGKGFEAYALDVASQWQNRKGELPSLGDRPLNVRLISWTFRSSSGERGATRFCATEDPQFILSVDRPLRRSGLDQCVACVSSAQKKTVSSSVSKHHDERQPEQREQLWFLVPQGVGKLRRARA